MIEQGKNRYKASRINAGLTQQQAAEALYVAVRTLSDYENGHARPPDSTVSAMVDVYGCPLLGYLHMHDSDLGRKVLAEVELPETDGEAAMQVYNAISNLEKVFKLHGKLAKGKPRSKRFCENVLRAKKTDLIKQVRKASVEQMLYLEKTATSETQNKKTEPPSHKRPRTAT